MLLFLKKKTEDSEVVQETKFSAERTPLHEFVPYYSHYNAHTLLTKNGELMQTIKITSNIRGLNYESGDDSQYTIRDVLRKAITESIGSDDYSLWIHTLRKRARVDYSGNFTEPFATYMHDKWQKKTRWQYQYYNEIYISILREGQHCKLFDQKSLKNVFLPKRNRKYRNTFLENISKELDKTVEGMLKKIRQHYNAERLTIVERMPEHLTGVTSPIFFSEPMEFLGTLINLHTTPRTLPEADISTALCDETVTFGFNALETKHENGQRRFGALLTLKQYREVTPEAVDGILQSPMELAISQAFHFIPQAEALKQYKQQKDIFDMSGDTYSVKMTGLDEMLRSNRKTTTDFGSQQTSIMIIVEEYKQLEDEVRKAQEEFAKLGLVTVREDIKFEECYWSQLPGNFEFIRRNDAISTSHIGGFARLNLFPNKNTAGTHWGEAVALVPTMVNSPYFFNFHHQDNGHTLLFDFNSFHDQTGHILLNFLTTSVLKYHPRLFVFDRHQSARLLFDKLAANYQKLPLKPDRNPGTLHLNPFSLEDNKRNQGFLLAWCLSLLDPAVQLDDNQKALLQTAISDLYAAPAHERNLNGLINKLSAFDANLARLFSDLRAQPGMGIWFDQSAETLDLTQPLQAFDMDAVVKQRTPIIPVFSYLLHRIVTSLDGRPTVIVLNEAWDLLENPFFAPRLESLMEMLKQNNAMIIFTTSNPPATQETATLATLLRHCATLLYAPDDVAADYEALGIALTAHDVRLMLKMERQKGHCLLKQNHESIGLSISLDEMDDVKAIFANDIKNLIAAGGRFASLPQDM